MTLEAAHCSCEGLTARLINAGFAPPCSIHGEKGKAEWDRLESRATTAEGERDEARRRLGLMHGGWATEAGEQKIRADAAEGRVRELEEALREIADATGTSTEAHHIARSALNPGDES